MGNYLGICWQYVWEHPWASAIVGIIITAFTLPIKKFWTDFAVHYLENWSTRFKAWWHSETRNEQGEILYEGQPRVNSAEARHGDRNTTRRRRKEDGDETLDRFAEHSGAGPSLEVLGSVKTEVFATGVEGLRINNSGYDDGDDGEEISREENPDKMTQSESEERKPEKVKPNQEGGKSKVKIGGNLTANTVLVNAKNVAINNSKKVKGKNEHTTGGVEPDRNVEDVSKQAGQKHDGQSKKPGMDRSILSKVEEITQEKTVIDIGGCRLKLSAYAVKKPTKHDIKYVVPGAPPVDFVHASSTLTFNPPFQGQKDAKITLPTWCSSEASVLVGIFTKTEKGDWKKFDRPNLTHEGHMELHYRYLSNITAFVPRDRLPDIQFKISCFLYSNVDGKFAMGFCLADKAIENMFLDRLLESGLLSSVKTLEPVTASFEDEITIRIIILGKQIKKGHFNVDEGFLSSNQGKIICCNTNADTLKIIQERKPVGNQADEDRLYLKSYNIKRKYE